MRFGWSDHSPSLHVPPALRAFPAEDYMPLEAVTICGQTCDRSSGISEIFQPVPDKEDGVQEVS